MLPSATYYYVHPIKAFVVGASFDLGQPFHPGQKKVGFGLGEEWVFSLQHSHWRSTTAEYNCNSEFNTYLP